MSRRRKGRPVFGLLLLDKPRGLSSNQAMQRARRALDANKAGHGGSLDPMAEGLLPILFGDATRLCSLALDGDKSYRFCMTFGADTDTGDAEGEIVRTCVAEPPSAGAIQALLPDFRGPQQQVPPMYSALKRDGRPLYALARKGVVVEREARSITVKQLELERVEGADAWLNATVSKGTYIRTLAEDLAHGLGHCAHLTVLQRTACAGLTLPGVSLEDLEAAPAEARLSYLRTVDPLLPDWPSCVLAKEELGLFRQGRRVPWRPGALGPDGSEVFIRDEVGRLQGWAKVIAAELQPLRVFSAERVGA